MNNLTLAELKEILRTMDVKKSGNKAEIISEIKRHFAKYKKYRKQTKDKYTKLRQIGNKGKEGLCYVVKDANNDQFVMKTFNQNKSYKNLQKEAEFQSLASFEFISPIIYDVDPVHKYIVMEKMDNHLSDLLELNKGKLSKKHQKRILHICKKLDKIGIFYDDPNILNFMLKNDTIYLIDYGMCKLIDDALIKKLNTKTPNQVYLKSAIIIKLKQANCDESSYNLLL